MIRSPHTDTDFFRPRNPPPPVAPQNVESCCIWDSVQSVEQPWIPYEAAFLAGKAFLAYRRRGGTKRSPPPDFFIGAHAAVSGYQLMTRDATRYRGYFPKLPLIAPR